MKTLTIIIPAYNEERYIRACLEAISAQTEPPEEVILVDNNSTDTTVQIAKEFPFVRIIPATKQGIVYARDAGFNAATSDIIGRIDADTKLPKDWVARVKSFYELSDHVSHALTGGGYFYNMRLPRFNGWGQGQIAFRLNRLISGFYILWGSNMAMPAAMWQNVKSEVCQRDDIHEDMDLAIHVHRAGYTITYWESLRVGVMLKRFWSRRNELKAHMQLWPRTLRVHGFKTWWVGSVGNFLLLAFMMPLGIVSEALARLLGRKSLKQDSWK